MQASEPGYINDLASSDIMLKVKKDIDIQLISFKTICMKSTGRLYC